MRNLYAGIAVVLSVVLFVSCGPDTKTIRRMQQIEEGVDNPTSIEELTTAIGKYRNRVEDIINAENRIGMWYKILAIRYLDGGLYGKALENFRMAIEYYPTNQNLYYYVGVCAGYLAKASLDFDATGSTSERDRYYRLAESAYLRAIELEPRYVRALYGLSILYVFELDEAAKAIPHLELIMDIETADINAMFVLARAYYSTGDIDRSVAMYDAIIKKGKDPKQVADAEENKATVLNSAYGKQ